MEFDRSAEDVGNVVLLEHVNLRVPDLWVARTFYVNGLGLTVDPYIDHGPRLLWVNAGKQQFHIPLTDGEADVLRGHIELSLPSLDTLVERLDRTAPHLSGTEFSYDRADDGVHVVGPWGNKYTCVAPSAALDMPLGIPRVVFTVPTGAAPGIARFYTEVLGAPSTRSEQRCDVEAGVRQTLSFVESDQVDDYDGHHLAVYVRDFSGPHAWLAKRGLIVEESDQHQYRFNWVVDPDTNERLFEVEHEVRSMRHPLYNRPLINKNADQRVRGYLPGADAFTPAEPPAIAAP